MHYCVTRSNLKIKFTHNINITGLLMCGTFQEKICSTSYCRSHVLLTFTWRLSMGSVFYLKSR
jgi:hypothetical protein